jgi:hypothetical protein
METPLLPLPIGFSSLGGGLSFDGVEQGPRSSLQQALEPFQAF